MMIVITATASFMMSVPATATTAAFSRSALVPAVESEDLPFLGNGELEMKTFGNTEVICIPQIITSAFLMPLSALYGNEHR